MYYSTKNAQNRVSLRQAVLQGLPADNGLYLPETLPRLDRELFIRLPQLSLPELAYEVAAPFCVPDLPEDSLRRLVADVLDFPLPLVELADGSRALELFHGPTLAFKDFGARFMARLLAGFVRDSGRKLTILAATSGDTGSAVASGFFGVEGIDVVILYPKGKVSPSQEYQLTMHGGNIRALRINGSFDDCQRMVKSAFLDSGLQAQRQLSSANSINIARLIPQMFYYFYAWSRLPVAVRAAPLFSVPSGNFGNLTAGLMAQRMGLPIAGFVAANNRNNIFTEYLAGGGYHPKPSVQTVSNAMDVGDPSNFQRLLALCTNNLEAIRSDISSHWFDDAATRRAIREVAETQGYILDPHGAVAWLALQKELKQAAVAGRFYSAGVFLETAHPAKFRETVEPEIGRLLPVPPALQPDASYVNHAVDLPADYSRLHDWLLDTADGSCTSTVSASAAGNSAEAASGSRGGNVETSL